MFVTLPPPNAEPHDLIGGIKKANVDEYRGLLSSPIHSSTLVNGFMAPWDASGTAKWALADSSVRVPE